MAAKIRVVQTPGLAAIGMMTPQVGMVTNEHGAIVALSGDYATFSSSPSAPMTYVYDLTVTAANAAGYGWPGSGGSVLFGHGNLHTESFYTTTPQNLNQTEMLGDSRPYTFVLVSPGEASSGVAPLIQRVD